MCERARERERRRASERARERRKKGEPAALVPDKAKEFVFISSCIPCPSQSCVARAVCVYVAALQLESPGI